MEESVDYKSEFYQGKILCVPPDSINHDRITRNLLARLNRALINLNCEAFSSNVCLWIESMEFFTYPDITIICGEPELYKGRDDTVMNPLIIIEVLYEATKGYDRGEKFQFYRTIPALREYILIDHYKTHVEQFSLDNTGKWFLMEYKKADDVLKFDHVDFQIALKDIYARVKFES